MRQWNHGKQLLRVWHHQCCTNGCKLPKKKKTYFHNNFVDGSNGQAHTSRLKAVLKIFVWQKKKKKIRSFFGFSCFGEGEWRWKQERGEQAQVITAAIILLCDSSYASAGFLRTDVISREMNGNLHGHSCTHGAMNKYTCALSCIRINTPTQRQRDANPARVWGGMQKCEREAQGERGGAAKSEGDNGVSGGQGGGVEGSEALFNLSRSVDRAETSAGRIDG